MYSGQLKSIVCLLLAMSMGVANALCDAAKRRFTVADDIAVAHFGDPDGAKAEPVTFSPDGRYFVVDTERGLLDQNRPESTLRVYRTEDVHQFLLHPEVMREPSPIWIFSRSTFKDGPIITNIRWVADSSGVAFLAKTELGSDQLFLADVKTKMVQALTLAHQHVTAFDIRDRDHLVYSVQSPVIRERAIRESKATSIVGTGRFLPTLVFPHLHRFASGWYGLSELWAVEKGRRFRVEDKSSGGRPIPLYRAGQRALALSPDGRSVVTALALRRVPEEWEMLYPPPLASESSRIRAGNQDLEAFDGFLYVSEYVLIDLSSGAVKPLTDAPIGEAAGWWGPVLSADWSSDGESVVLSNTFLPPLARDSDGQPTRPCVAVVDLVKGHLTCLERLKGQAKTKTGYEDGRHVINSVQFARGTGGDVTVAYYGMDGSKGSTTYVRSTGGSWMAAAEARGWPGQDRAIEIDVKESFKDPPVLVAIDKTTKTSRVFLDPNPQLKDIDLGDVSLYTWKDKNGRESVGGLYKPPDYVQGQRYPLIIQTHGFYQVVFRQSGMYSTAFAARELAAVGILVLQVPDCPFTVDPEEGPCNAAAYEAAVGKLVEEGRADPDRVGIIGFSRTCYYVLHALTTSKVQFKAASITDGVTFGYVQYIHGVDAYGNASAHGANRMIGAPPFGKGLQQWFKRSPGFNMDKVTTPLQVVALGRWSLISMWEPYAVLRYLNKPVDLILLAEGTHVLTNPAERMASQGGTVDWFRFWLQDYEEPDPAKAEQYARWRGLRKLQEENQKHLNAH